jgi:GNAT superfamily N-acetyltransferase
MKIFIKESNSLSFKEVDKETFENALLNQSINDLEDGQVSYPNMNDREQHYLTGDKGYSLYLLDKEEFPNKGPFELNITNDEDENIGFIRGTVSNKIISFNLIHIQEEYRGQGIGSDIYQQFLDDGYIFRSDSQITDATYSLYTGLLIYGYTPIVFNDGRAGLKK